MAEDGFRPARAAAQMAGARPQSPQAHLAGEVLLLAESAGVYSLDPATAGDLRRAMAGGEAALTDALARLGLDAPIAPTPATPGPVRALALTVSQSCNMACGYCYASGGGFGGPDTAMPLDVAKTAIDRLIAEAPPGAAVRIAFMGGEPMLARDLIVQAVRHARARAARRAVDLGFAMTTNGTLLREADAAFLAEQGFTVTVSLDGERTANDRLRPMRGGAGSFDRVARGIAPLIARADRIALSARVTVTPDNLDIPGTVAALSALGFRSVGVSPMLTAPTGQGALRAEDLPVMLEAMMQAGDRWMAATLAGRPHAFANLATALSELHRGRARSLSCGAVREYLAVDAQGNYAACHRFVNDPLGQMGDLALGVDQRARADFLAARDVAAQTPCQGCWARRLCGGGCHHEVLHAGRPACDFVRGWLDYALQSYARMQAERPDWFADD